MSSKNNPRYLSLGILCQSAQKREPVDTVMDRILGQGNLTDPRDSHLTMALVYGVLRHRRYLDAVLGHYSRHPLKKMKPITLQALRLGAYQLLFMDRIPPSAAVNETVNSVKSAGQPKWMVSFVNGVLRALARNGYRPDLWGAEDWPPAVRLNLPDWLFGRYQKRYGLDKAVEICEFNNQQPCLTLCLNLSVVSRDEFMNILASRDIRAIRGRYLPEAVILPEYGGRIGDLPGYERGCFMIQDEGAQLITRMLAPFQTGSYLDACAGVGGKTVQLSFLLPKSCSLTALEPNQRRFTLLKENLKRMGRNSTVAACNTNLQDFRRQSGICYNGILIDAPCSGLGVIRRHPDIRWNFPRGGADLQPYRLTQLQLLKEAGNLLGEGGVLVYGTCSTEPEENEEVIKQFIADHPGFGIEHPELPEECQNLIDGQGFLRLIPGEYNDGFFAARLVKRM